MARKLNLSEASTRDLVLTCLVDQISAAHAVSGDEETVRLLATRKRALALIEHEGLRGSADRDLHGYGGAAFTLMRDVCDVLRDEVFITAYGKRDVDLFDGTRALVTALGYRNAMLRLLTAASRQHKVSAADNKLVDTAYSLIDQVDKGL